MGGSFFGIVLVAHIVLGLALIVFVLLQHGKGADVGASFGSGSSGSLFGATGSANFLSRVTGMLATAFFLTSLGLTYLANRTGDVPGVSRSVMEGVEQQSAPTATPELPKSESKSSDIPK